jgi:hypothetical protein
MMTLLVRHSPQKDRVGHVALKDVLGRASRGLRSEAVLPRNARHDLPVVDRIERAGHRTEREPVEPLLADDAETRRQIPAKLGLEGDDLPFKDSPQRSVKTQLDLDSDAAREARPIDQLQTGIVEGQGALADEIGIEIDRDSR